ncbi:MAG: hypothetical protein IKD72_03570 [Clostridia bacterium]|nr:hypothetical protein [Clostridia bacterium]
MPAVQIISQNAAQHKVFLQRTKMSVRAGAILLKMIENERKVYYNFQERQVRLAGMYPHGKPKSAFPAAPLPAAAGGGLKFGKDEAQNDKRK